MWRLFSSLMARLTRFAKRESCSFEGCSPALPARLSIWDQRSPVSHCSSSDRVSTPDRLSTLILLSASNFVSLSVMTYSETKFDADRRIRVERRSGVDTRSEEEQ